MTPAIRHFRPAIETLESRIAPAAVATINLEDLGGSGGFRILAESGTEYATTSVSAAGDLNDDGIDDLLIGAVGGAQNGAGSGVTYVVFGSAAGFTTPVDLATLNGTNGFRLRGETADDGAGRAVSAGDVNGDGIDDLLIGASGADLAGSSPGNGASYVVFGRTTAFPATFELSSLNGTNGFRLHATTGLSATGDLAGTSVSAAGDVNGDGFADLLIGAPSATPNGIDSGATYVVFGKAGAFASPLNLSALNGTTGFKITGAEESDNSGESVSAAGDVNGDGFDDLIIAAPFASPNGVYEAGASFVVFGRSSGFGATLNLGSLDGANGFKIEGKSSRDFLGQAVSGAGDMNGDGFDDLLIGAPGADPFGASSGASYVVFGKSGSFAQTLNVATLNGASGFKIQGEGAGDETGVAVSGAGDVNGDGLSDVIIGAGGADAGRGAAFVVYGRVGGFGALVNLSTLNGVNGVKLAGGPAPDFAGYSVGGGGDVNGDGLSDVIVGSEYGGYTLFGGTQFRVGIAAPGTSAIFQDADGDIVTVKTSKGGFSPDNFVLTPVGSGATFTGWQLEVLDLESHPSYQGTSLTISAKKPLGGTGDGFVDHGVIDASDLDLATVTTTGDVGKILAGDAILTTPAVKQLTVGSLGQYPENEPAGTVEPQHSVITGGLGALLAKTHVTGHLEVTGALGLVTIGGNLDGSAGGPRAGLLESASGIGAVTVKGNVIGGADLSGIVSGGKLGKVTINGDLTSADALKRVTVSAFGKAGATVAADALAISGLAVKSEVLNARVLAGFNTTSGAVDNATAGIGPVVIGKNVKNSVVRAAGALGSVLIGGDLDGSAGGARAGLLEGGTAVGAVTVKGSVIGGADFSGILSGGKLAKVTILKDLTGTTARPVTIAALGKLGAKTAADAIAIAGLAVTGTVSQARILAGYNLALTATNSDAGIGTITAANWTASSVAAGVTDSTGNGFGRNDSLIAGDTTPALLATIASFTIKTAATGSATAGDHFGVTAQRVLKATIGKTILPLTTGANDALIDAANADFRVVDFA